MATISRISQVMKLRRHLRLTLIGSQTLMYSSNLISLGIFLLIGLVTLHNFSYLVCTDQYQGSRRTNLATALLTHKHTQMAKNTQAFQ